MTIGILNYQGAIQDHIPHLQALGCAYIPVINPEDLEKISGLIIPGGESTVMGKYLAEYGLAEPVLDAVDRGMGIWGICAGSILLAKRVKRASNGAPCNDLDESPAPGSLGLLDMTIERNAYGRQRESRYVTLDIPDLQLNRFSVPFIRAPKIIETRRDIAILARRENNPVFVRVKRVMATTFHPELTGNNRLHRYFISLLSTA